MEEFSTEQLAQRLHHEMRFVSYHDIVQHYDEVVIKDIYRIAELSRKLKLTSMLDLGSNVGVSSLWFKQNNPGAFVVGVEPGTQQHGMYMLNAVPFGCVSYHAALGPEGVCHMADETLATGEKSDGRGWDFALFGNGEIPSHPLEWYVSRHPEFRDMSDTFLKVDTEGAEQYLCNPDSWGFVEHSAVVAMEIHFGRRYPGEGLSRKDLTWLLPSLLIPLSHTHQFISFSINSYIGEFSAVRRDLIGLLQ